MKKESILDYIPVLLTIINIIAIKIFAFNEDKIFGFTYILIFVTILMSILSKKRVFLIINGILFLVALGISFFHSSFY